MIERIEDASARIRDAIADDMRSRGWSRLMIERHFERTAETQSRAHERMCGYAGWLVTNAEFQLSRIAFCYRWQDVIRESGQMPSIPPLEIVDRHPVVPESEREYYSEYIHFLAKWSLETLSTWQLPLPMQANPLGLAPYNQLLLGESGLKLFIPWYLLADGDVRLGEIIEHATSYGHIGHLDEWLQSGGGHSAKKGWGFERFATMLQMYIYLENGLYDRYAARVTRNVGRIDEAFTEFKIGKRMTPHDLTAKAESTRKTRLELGRRLHRYATEVHEQLDAETEALVSE